MLANTHMPLVHTDGVTQRAISRAQTLLLPMKTQQCATAAEGTNGRRTLFLHSVLHCDVCELRVCNIGQTAFETFTASLVKQNSFLLTAVVKDRSLIVLFCQQSSRTHGEECQGLASKRPAGREWSAARNKLSARLQ